MMNIEQACGAFKVLLEEQQARIANANEEKKDFSKMETVGLVRAIDDLGRVSIPVEARKVMGLKERDLLEQKLYKDEKGDIVIVMKKYSS